MGQAYAIPPLRGGANLRGEATHAATITDDDGVGVGVGARA
jgi:hypothetical protein